MSRTLGELIREAIMANGQLSIPQLRILFPDRSRRVISRATYQLRDLGLIAPVAGQRYPRPYRIPTNL
jgi:hypothetical protein